MWVEFIVASLLCPERFFSRYMYSSFPSPQKPTFPIQSRMVDEEPLCGCDRILIHNYSYSFYSYFIHLHINQFPLIRGKEYRMNRRIFISYMGVWCVLFVTNTHVVSEFSFSFHMAHALSIIIIIFKNNDHDILIYNSKVMTVIGIL